MSQQDSFAFHYKSSDSQGVSTVTRNDAINAIKRVFDFVRVVTHFHRISESYRVILLTLVNVSKMTHWACESVSPHGQNWRLILWHLLHHLTQMLSTLSHLSESCDSIKERMSQITHQICIRLLRSVSLYGQTKDSLQWVIWLSIYFLCMHPNFNGAMSIIKQTKECVNVKIIM